MDYHQFFSSSLSCGMYSCGIHFDPHKNVIRTLAQFPRDNISAVFHETFKNSALSFSLPLPIIPRGFHFADSSLENFKLIALVGELLIIRFVPPISTSPEFNFVCRTRFSRAFMIRYIGVSFSLARPNGAESERNPTMVSAPLS